MNEPALRKHRTLIIAEGKWEKETLFKTICMTFKELDIDWDRDVITYETNIYDLYDKIIDYYGDSEPPELMDVDLPILLKTKLKSLEGLTKQNFTNVLLVFDFEPHDPGFTPEKTSFLLTLFSDSSDNGKLYFNYPMVESLFDFHQDEMQEVFNSRHCLLPGLNTVGEEAVKFGSNYKNTANKRGYHCQDGIFRPFKNLEAIIASIINDNSEMKKVLDVLDVLDMLSDLDSEESVAKLFADLNLHPSYNQLCHICALLFKEAKAANGSCPISFRIMIRERLIKLTRRHKIKALYITKMDAMTFAEINYEKILNHQLELVGTDQIDVLNTSILFLHDFNPSLLE